MEIALSKSRRAFNMIVSFNRILPAAPVMLAVALASTAPAQDSRWDELANQPFPNGYPTEKARTSLLDELYFERAVQVYMGALPAVNMVSIRDGSEAKWGAGSNIFPVWKERMGAKVLVPTPNADVIYAMGYLDLKKDGPLVVSVPPGILGLFDDFWQRALTDVGYAGPDKGQGGLYLLLPPDYEGPVPGGYYTYKSPTYNVFMFWRALLTKGAEGPETAKGVATIEQTMVYPLRNTTPGTWKKMSFPDAALDPITMLYPTDARYFDLLAKFIDYEPLDASDPYLRGMMASIGIVKGEPFDPDPRHRQILDRAAKTAVNMTYALSASPDMMTGRRYYKQTKRQWMNAFSSIDDKFYSSGYLNLDVRSVYFASAYASSPGMASTMVGAGAKYPVTLWDAEGKYLVGGNTYKLHLPPNPPAKLFWAVTLYKAQFGLMVDAKGQPFPSINSNAIVKANSDGSYDLYFGPQLPQGVPETNYIKTNSGEGFQVALRLYAPSMPFFDESWIPDDVVMVR